MRQAALFAVLLLSCGPHSRPPPTTAQAAPLVAKAALEKASIAKPDPATVPSTNPDTRVFMHHVLLDEGGITLRIRWLRARMYPVKQNGIPCFDDRKSFFLQIDDGVMGISLKDLSAVLNATALKNSALKNVNLTPYGKQIKITGTLHKGIPLPIEALAELSTSPDGRAHLTITKMQVLHMPARSMLKAFHVRTADLLNASHIDGVEVSDDDIYLEPSKLLPGPRKYGRLTGTRLEGNEILEMYGAVDKDLVTTKEWRNFIALRGGNVEFGKLKMHHADIVMIGNSRASWFLFNAERYQEQLVNGYVRMTPEAGLRIFMPNFDQLPHSRPGSDSSLDWLKNRDAPVPVTLR